MTLTATIETKKTETISADFDLPYYAQDLLAFYCVNENESITKLFIADDYASIVTEAKTSPTYGSALKRVMSGAKSSYAEFMQQLEKANTFHEQQMLSTVNG